MACVFCSIINLELPSALVLDEPDVVAFLDARPVFPGHVLVVPRVHYETLLDLPAGLAAPMLLTAQRVAVAVMKSLDADGTFVAMNNIVSQSVPHLHIHVVPRRRKDGLRGFFWPRQHYRDEEEMASYADRIRGALVAHTSG